MFFRENVTDSMEGREAWRSRKSGAAAGKTIEPAHYGFNCPYSGQLLYHQTVTQQHYHRYAAHGKTRCQRLIYLGTDLDDSRPAGQFISYGSHRRCERDAVRSPGRPELGQHRAGIAGDKTVEIAVGQLLRMTVHRGQSCLAAATATGFSFLVCRDAVIGAARRAGDDIAGHACPLFGQ